MRRNATQRKVRVLSFRFWFQVLSFWFWLWVFDFGFWVLSFWRHTQTDTEWGTSSSFDPTSSCCWSMSLTTGPSSALRGRGAVRQKNKNWNTTIKEERTRNWLKTHQISFFSRQKLNELNLSVQSEHKLTLINVHRSEVKKRIFQI